MSNTSNLNSVHFLNDTHGWAAGGSGVVLHTSDGGDTWDVQDSGVPFNLEGVQFLDGRKGYAVGDNGVLIESLDGGKTWANLYSARQEGGETERLLAGTMPGWKLASGYYDVHFPTANDGWGVGLLGKVVHSNDGGKHGMDKALEQRISR